MRPDRREQTVVRDVLHLVEDGHSCLSPGTATTHRRTCAASLCRWNIQDSSRRAIWFSIGGLICLLQLREDKERDEALEVENSSPSRVTGENAYPPPSRITSGDSNVCATN